MVNGKEISVAKNETGTDRGLHIVVVDPISGETEFAQAFDTYKSSDAFEEFIGKFQKLPDGKVIIAACKDDCVLMLSPAGLNFFSSMGS